MCRWKQHRPLAERVSDGIIKYVVSSRLELACMYPAEPLLLLPCLTTLAGSEPLLHAASGGGGVV